MRALEGHLLEIADHLSNIAALTGGILVFLIVSSIIDRIIK